MNSLVLRNRRAASGLAIALFALLTLVMPLHHDHGSLPVPGADAEAGSATTLPSDGQSSQGPLNDCRLCNWTRTSLRPVATASLNAPRTDSVACRPDVVSPLESHSLVESPLLRAPPSV